MHRGIWAASIAALCLLAASTLVTAQDFDTWHSEMSSAKLTSNSSSTELDHSIKLISNLERTSLLRHVDAVRSSDKKRHQIPSNFQAASTDLYVPVLLHFASLISPTNH